MEKFPWKSLINWYKKYGRHHLEWRRYNEDKKITGYHVWLSEICLQQTQVERVRGYFLRIVEHFPRIEDIANLSYEEFYPYYQGLGYYSRARNILETARIIVKEYGGVFPNNKELLERLPGIGSYTARAIMAFIFEEKYLAWDTNLEKVFARYYHGSRFEKLSQKEKDIIEQDFQEFVGDNKHLVRMINNALMDFSSLIDLKNPRNIDWKKYPIKRGLFYSYRGNREYQENRKPLYFPIPDAKIILILHKDHKIYLSEKKDIYSPFFLPPSLSRNIRGYIQKSFREKYRIDISVRPPHKKWIDETGTPYIAVHAQIQVGVHNFSLFSKRDIRDILKGIIPD